MLVCPAPQPVHTGWNSQSLYTFLATHAEEIERSIDIETQLQHRAQHQFSRLHSTLYINHIQVHTEPRVSTMRSKPDDSAPASPASLSLSGRLSSHSHDGKPLRQSAVMRSRSFLLSSSFLLSFLSFFSSSLLLFLILPISSFLRSCFSAVDIYFYCSLSPLSLSFPSSLVQYFVLQTLSDSHRSSCRTKLCKFYILYFLLYILVCLSCCSLCLSLPTGEMRKLLVLELWR